MKVAVITRHAITNYGSLLQAFATQQVIENLGHTCEIIDYIRDDESYSQHEKTLLARKPEWNRNPLKKQFILHCVSRKVLHLEEDLKQNNQNICILQRDMQAQSGC